MPSYELKKGINDLATLSPEIAKECQQKGNGNTRSYQVFNGSTDKYLW